MPNGRVGEAVLSVGWVSSNVVAATTSGDRFQEPFLPTRRAYRMQRECERARMRGAAQMRSAARSLAVPRKLRAGGA